MKKKLEGELISIAHRVLKLRNRSETVILQQEAKNIYEQLTILRFYEENFETLKNDISQEELEEKLEQMTIAPEVETVDLEEKVAEAIEIAEPIAEVEKVIEAAEVTEEQEEIVAETIAPTEIVEEEIIEEEVEAEVISEIVEAPKEEVYATSEDINRIVSEMANQKNVSEETLATNDVPETAKPNKPQQISFEDLLGESYKEPEFVRVEDTPKEVELTADVVFEKKEAVEHATEDIFERANEKPKPEKEEFSFKAPAIEKQESKSMSLNDRFNTGISFGLNDRIAFEKKLFGGSSDDFNRVISQLNTFDSYEEAKGFIESFVKPDYNDWDGKEEYETRFLEIVEKKFN